MNFDNMAIALDYYEGRSIDEIVLGLQWIIENCLEQGTPIGDLKSLKLTELASLHYYRVIVADSQMNQRGS